MTDLRGKHILVMGLGVHGGGLGVARFLAGQGAHVTVTDLRGPDQLQSSLAALAGLPIQLVLGEHRDEDFRAAELVIRNPAVPSNSRYLQLAAAAGATIETEMTLFFRLCPGPILGITGTKGKTTTTMLVGAMLREQFPATVVAGNLRVSALEQLPRIGPTTPVVLELSSFALENLGAARLSPHYACITNISPDHLDRYPSITEYAEAKAQIFRHQEADGVVVLNAEDARLAAWADQRGQGVVRFAMQTPATTPAAYWQDDTLVWQADQQIEPLADRADVQLAGIHNQANIAAAAALAKAFGVTNAHIRSAIQRFGAVEHRLEPVRTLDGVTYINDTAATAPEAAIAALHSFSAPIVLLAGGADKNMAFDSLAAAIAGRAKAVVLLHGSATPKLMAALGQVGMAALGPFDDFAQAIASARRLAAPGDVVLLSPGCASFGMFQNEFQRGEEFRRIVGALPAQAGH